MFFKCTATFLTRGLAAIALRATQARVAKPTSGIKTANAKPMKGDTIASAKLFVLLRVANGVTTSLCSVASATVVRAFFDHLW